MLKLNPKLKDFTTEELIREINSRAKNEKAVVIENASKVYEYLIEYSLKNEEHFILLILNTKGQIKKKIEISKGTINNCIVHPREVFYYAIKHQANAIIVAHNHPSGDPMPSREDNKITETLKEVSNLVGIKLLDHIIIGKEGYFSYSESFSIL